MSTYSLTLSETDLAQEYKYQENSDENESDWDDCTLINPDEQEIIPINYNHNGTKCWQCDYCLEINHLNISITQYNSKCCKCEYSSYIESETPTFYTDKWYIPIPIVPQQIHHHLVINNEANYTLHPQIVDKHSDLVSGYCKNNYNQNIPTTLQQIITSFYKLGETLSYKKQSGMTMFVHNSKCTAVELYGDTRIHYPQSKQWCFRLDIEDGDNNACIEGIEFGVVRQGFKVEVGGNITYYLLDIDDKDLKQGDIIRMELDLSERTLSFGINDKWFGIQHKEIYLSGTYQFYANIKQKGVSLQLCQ